MSVPPDSQRRGTLTTWKIVCFVIAATTPMAAMVGTVPLGFTYGTGAGMPAMYLIAGLIMLCFISGYSAMSRHVVNTGAMYTYIRAGLGRIAGASAAYLAVLSYVTFTIGIVGGFGYFGSVILDLPGVPWPCYSAVLLLVMTVLGRRKLDLSVAVLGVLMGAEVLILLVTDAGVAVHKGLEALPTASFSPTVVFGAGVAAAVTFAFTSFIGIESAPLYSEEARDPRRSVARAGFWSVILITIFYTLTTWLAVGGIGVDNVQQRASDEGGELFFGLAAQYTAPWVGMLMALLLMTSFIATAVALQNATSRYLFALGREGLLPRWLGVRHPKLGSPARANLVLTSICAVVILAAGLAGLDPYLNVTASLVSLATVGIMVLMLGASLATIVYFVRKPAEAHWWRTKVGPGIALVGLAVATVLVLSHYRYLTGSDLWVINRLPLLVLIAVVAGAGRAVWLRARRPETYAEMHPEAEPAVAQSELAEPASVNATI